MKNTKYKIEFTEKALNMIKLHIQYLTLIDINIAKVFKEKIFSASKTLEVLPNRCPLLGISDMTDKYRKLIIDDKYILVYKVIENIVCIEYFLDCKQDYKWLL